MSLSEFCEFVMDREAWYTAVHGITKNRTQLSNWTELNWTERCCEEKWALCSAGGNINGTVAMENSMMESQKSYK